MKNYLTAAAADSTEALLVDLRDAGSARKGMTRLAEAAEVNRVNLFQMLSREGNPGIRNIRGYASFAVSIHSRTPAGVGPVVSTSMRTRAPLRKWTIACAEPSRWATVAEKSGS